MPLAGQGGWISASSAKRTLVDVMRVNRHGEGCQRSAFYPWRNLGNRRLLWHGTNIAVVAAIMKSGLRIMPHSGGRVGRGIYLASENCKSASYVQPDYGSKTGAPRPNAQLRLACFLILIRIDGDCNRHNVLV